MADIPEAALQFPTSFPIKAMGRAEDGFAARVADLIRQHVAALEDDAVSSRLSGGGRFMSVTIVIEAQSREQLDRIYQDLSAADWVLMAL